MIKHERNNLIDLLRFIAAISVAVFHFYAIPDIKVQNWYKVILGYGHIGVPIFFIISGYCILIALEHSKTSLAFITRRFFRIFPPYWFSLLVTAAVIFIFKYLKGINSLSVIPKSPKDVVATLFLLTDPITSVKNINWVYWTLPYEIFFYIVIYLCSYFKGLGFTIVLIFISAITCILPVSYHGFLSYFRFWPYFCLGASLYKILHGSRDERPLSFVLMAFTLADFYFVHESLLYCAVAIVVVLLIIYSYFKPIKSNALTKLGDLSYSIYLLHIPIGVYCFERFRERPPLQSNGILNFMLDIVLIVFIIYLSRLMHQHIEIPFIRMGKKLTNTPKIY